jgi:hypothetical protein
MQSEFHNTARNRALSRNFQHCPYTDNFNSTASESHFNTLQLALFSRRRISNKWARFVPSTRKSSAVLIIDVGMTVPREREVDVTERSKEEFDELVYRLQDRIKLVSCLSRS